MFKEAADWLELIYNRMIGGLSIGLVTAVSPDDVLDLTLSNDTMFDNLGLYEWRRF